MNSSEKIVGEDVSPVGWDEKDEKMSASKLRPVEFVVPHSEGFGLRWVSVVRAQASEEAVDEKNFLDSLRRAITRWINTSERGQAAWLESCRDFNIGDLCNEFPLDGELTAELAAAGIFGLEVNSYGNASRFWVHDTRLVDEFDLPIPEEADD